MIFFFMRTYFKLFDNHTQCEDFSESSGYVKPNICCCIFENEIHYNVKRIDHYLTFIAEEPNSTVQMNKVISAATLNVNLQYSTDDGETWTNYTFTNYYNGRYSGITITLSKVGDSVKFRGNNNKLNVDGRNYHMFKMTGKVSAKGDVTSLLNGSGGNVTLPSFAFYNMFNGCTSLITAPELPSTTLAEYCYYMMFRLTSLTKAPELPATTLATSCYYNLFNGCNNLSYIKALFTTTPSATYTGNWVYGVASSGTFVKNSSATWDVTGVNGIPTGWTVQTASS